MRLPKARRMFSVRFIPFSGKGEGEKGGKGEGVKG
jgi:hypothetical protein